MIFRRDIARNVSTMTTTINNMNKIFQKLFLCCFLLSATIPTQAQFSGSGSGTPNDPYIITTPAQLAEVHNELDKHYKLANDIDLTDYLAPGGNGYAQWGDAGWKPLGHYFNVNDYAEFTGSFNGASYKVTGVWINRPGNSDVGFFGQTGNNATIDSLGIEIAEAGIKGGAYTGGLVGSQGTVNDNISHCYVTGGSVSGNTTVGGLVGLLVSNMSHCYSTVDVDGSNAGGLVGTNLIGSINNCYATGNVNGRSYAGGLVGIHRVGSARIINSYATGRVSGSQYIGGLIGERPGLMENIINSFFDTETAGRTNAVGIGFDQGITGLTTEEMQTAATFKDWDSDVWGIYEGYGYLYLRGFNNDMLIVPEGGSKVYDGQPAPGIFNVISDNPNVDCTIAKNQLTGKLAFSPENAVNVGEYTVIQHTLHSPHHQISFKRGVTYTITQRPLTIEAIDDTIRFGETPTLAYHVTPGDLIDGDALTGELFVNSLEIGEHTITQGTLTAGENYFIIFINGTLTVLDDHVDINKVLADKQSLTAFPNPTSGQLIINNEQTTFGASQLTINNIQVFDLNGKLVLQPTTNPFDMSRLPNGTYMIKVNNETIKIVKN